MPADPFGHGAERSPVAALDLLKGVENTTWLRGVCEVNEKRSTPRAQTFLKALAICPDGLPAIDCLICDISETGARLQPADGGVITAFPERFELLVPRSGERYRVRVAWRGVSELGVAFEVTQDRP